MLRMIFSSLFYIASISGCSSDVSVNESLDNCQVANPPRGTVCSRGAIWVGEIPATINHAGNNAGKFNYMIMPSGCDGTTLNPVCSGNDTYLTRRSWNDKTANDGNAGVEQFSVLTAKSTILGDTNTDILALATVPISGGAYEAAKYCADMVYGGYSDWYLPSKSELAYIYCKTQPAATHLVSQPYEDPNCDGDYGGKESLFTGFDNHNYWSSTEASAGYSWYQSFGSGFQHNTDKKHTLQVRCLRRF